MAGTKKRHANRTKKQLSVAGFIPPGPLQGTRYSAQIWDSPKVFCALFFKKAQLSSAFLYPPQPHALGRKAGFLRHRRRPAPGLGLGRVVALNVQLLRAQQGGHADNQNKTE
jgi:hypothetical protein